MFNYTIVYNHWRTVALSLTIQLIDCISDTNLSRYIEDAARVDIPVLTLLFF